MLLGNAAWKALRTYHIIELDWDKLFAFFKCMCLPCELLFVLSSINHTINETTKKNILAFILFSWQTGVSLRLSPSRGQLRHCMRFHPWFDQWARRLGSRSLPDGMETGEEKSRSKYFDTWLGSDWLSMRQDPDTWHGHMRPKWRDEESSLCRKYGRAFWLPVSVNRHD